MALCKYGEKATEGLSVEEEKAPKMANMEWESSFYFSLEKDDRGSYGRRSGM